MLVKADMAGITSFSAPRSAYSAKQTLPISQTGSQQHRTEHLQLLTASRPPATTIRPNGSKIALGVNTTGAGSLSIDRAVPPQSDLLNPEVLVNNTVPSIFNYSPHLRLRIATIVVRCSSKLRA